MVMEITARTSDPSAVSRAFPWPVLEAGNGSFVEGSYTVALEHKRPGRSFTMLHRVHGAKLITDWIEDGKVLFICSVAAPNSAYRTLHASDNPEQTIEWDPDDLGTYPLFTPMIVASSDFEHFVDSDADGVSPLWDGRTLHLLKGSRLAVCSTFALQSGVLGLLEFCLKEDYAPGVFSVEPSREDGFKFKVYLAEDLFNHLKYQRQEVAGANIMTHVVSAALTYLKNDFSRDDGDEGWQSYINLRALANHLESRDLGCWDDENFEPELVATRLYPHRIPTET